MAGGKKARDEYSSTLKHRLEYNSAHKEMVRGLESSTPYQTTPPQKKTQESLPVHYSYKFKENLTPSTRLLFLFFGAAFLMPLLLNSISSNNLTRKLLLLRAVENRFTTMTGPNRCNAKSNINKERKKKTSC